MGTSVKGQRDPVKARFWRGHVVAWRGSGESIVGYCRRHGLLEQSFHYWKKALAPEGDAVSGAGDAGAGGADGVAEVGGEGEVGGGGELVASRASGSAASPVRPAFAEVRVVAEPSASGLSVVLEGGREVGVSRGFDAETLRRVVVALESLPC